MLLLIWSRNPSWLLALVSPIVLLLACLPQAGTWYNIILALASRLLLLLASCYLILVTWYSFTIECRTPIEEWRNGDLCSDSNGTSEGTSYLVLGTLYNEVLLLDTNYLILFLISNAELRLMNEEVGFVFWLKWHSLSYFVPGTAPACRRQVLCTM